MTVNLLKEGGSNLDTPQPLPSLPPPHRKQWTKSWSRRGEGDKQPLSGGRRGKEPFLRNTDESIRAILAPNVCNQPPPDILKSVFFAVDYQLPNKEDVTDKPVEERILQALSYTL